LLRFEADADAGKVAGVSGTSVERFAASSAAADVSVGCAGGGWRRLTTGLREPQPDDVPRRKTQSAMRRKPDFAGLDPTDIDSVEILKGRPAS
jgi:outer membrane receptor protein involved in Fe transport